MMLVFHSEQKINKLRLGSQEQLIGLRVMSYYKETCEDGVTYGHGMEMMLIFSPKLLYRDRLKSCMGSSF
jgi:hypothetical protein